MTSTKAIFVYGLIAIALVVIGYLIVKSDRKETSTVKPTPASKFQTTPLHQSAKEGNLERCRQLISNNSNLQSLDEHGWSPLIIAVMHDHVEIAQLFLQEGAKLHYTYSREDTHQERKKHQQEINQFSSKSKTKESLEELFKDVPKEIRDEIISEENLNQMNENLVDLHFQPRKEHAIEHCQNIDMLKLLITKYDADINYVGEDSYWPLSTFAENNDLKVVTWLLENGADPNTTSTGSTALFCAVSNDNLTMVKLLIHHGAKTNILDVDGCTPFLRCESVPMAILLLEHDTDPTILDQAGFPCWQFIDDSATKTLLKQEALRRGLKSWTTLP